MTNQLRYRIKKLQSLGLVKHPTEPVLRMGPFFTITIDKISILNNRGWKSLRKQVKYYREWNCF